MFYRSNSPLSFRRPFAMPGKKSQQEQGVVPATIASAWEFDNSLVEYNSNGLDWVAVNGYTPLYVTGKISQAINVKFSGYPLRINPVPTSYLLDFNKNWGISFWFKSNLSSVGGFILTLAETSADTNYQTQFAPFSSWALRGFLGFNDAMTFQFYYNRQGLNSVASSNLVGFNNVGGDWVFGVVYCDKDNHNPGKYTLRARVNNGSILLMEFDNTNIPEYPTDTSDLSFQLQSNDAFRLQYVDQLVIWDGIPDSDYLYNNGNGVLL